MQSLNDDERKQVLTEVLADELKVITEYVKEIPTIKRQLNHVHDKVNTIIDRLNIIETVARSHEASIKLLT